MGQAGEDRGSMNTRSISSENLKYTKMLWFLLGREYAALRLEGG